MYEKTHFFAQIDSKVTFCGIHSINLRVAKGDQVHRQRSIDHGRVDHPLELEKRKRGILSPQPIIPGLSALPSQKTDELTRDPCSTTELDDECNTDLSLLRSRDEAMCYVSLDLVGSLFRHHHVAPEDSSSENQTQAIRISKKKFFCERSLLLTRSL